MESWQSGCRHKVRSRNAGNAAVFMFYVYILKSRIANRHYIGFTSDIEKRFMQHNSGRTKSTKGYLPWDLVYFEKFELKNEALKREKEIKSFKSGIKFKQLLESWQSG